MADVTAHQHCHKFVSLFRIYLICRQREGKPAKDPFRYFPTFCHLILISVITDTH